jgi:hypothetical protein
MTVCSKISGQKDRYMLRMHRTRDQVFLLTSCLNRQTSAESATHCCEARIASCLLVTINLIGQFPPPQYPIGKFFSKNLSFPYIC